MAVNDQLTDRLMQEAVADYIEHHREVAARELDFYRSIRTLRAAISRAARAHTADGGKHPHQRRIPCDTLRAFGATLAQKEQALSAAQSFDELHRAVRDAGDRTDGIGELAVYDTALRIGARLGLEPERVYLHRGTRDGAAAVGVDPRRPTVSASELPAAFAKLDPHEIEDCLCIFKGLLAGNPAPLTGCRCNSRGCARPRHRTARARC